MSFATGIMIPIAVIGEFFIKGDLLDYVKNPYIYGFIVFLIVTWLISIILTFTVLLFSSKKREEAFLIVSKTEVRDELEQKALSDAIKSTFILNIVLLSLVYLISGVKLSTSISHSEDKKSHVSIVLEVPPKGYEGNTVKNIPEKELAQKPIHENAKKLIPQRVYSPDGLFILILIQFLSFKFFLFLNKRALE